MTHLAVPAELAQWLAQYLSLRPYAEVAERIDQLKACKGVTLDDDPDRTD